MKKMHGMTKAEKLALAGAVILKIQKAIRKEKTPVRGVSANLRRSRHKRASGGRGRF